MTELKESFIGLSTGLNSCSFIYQKGFELDFLDSCGDKRDEVTQRGSGHSLLSHSQDDSPDKRIVEVGRK